MEKTEGYPVDFNLVKEDTLSAVYENRKIVKDCISKLPTEEVNYLIQELNESPDIPKINFDHPFGHYIIPVLSTDIQSEIKSPVDIKFVADDYSNLKDKHIGGGYDVTEKTIYLRASEFTNENRLCSWIFSSGNDLPEKTIEHEVRHGIFHKIVEEYGGGIINIDEGYAFASKYDSYHKDNSFLQKINFGAYKGDFKDSKEIANYYHLFQIIQNKNFDDVELIKYMNDHNFWAEIESKFELEEYDWDLSFSRIRGKISNFIGGTENMELLIEKENIRKRDTLLNFNYGVWQHTLHFLEKHQLEPYYIDWPNEIKKAEIMREAYEKSMKEFAITP